MNSLVVVLYIIYTTVHGDALRAFLVYQDTCLYHLPQCSYIAPRTVSWLISYIQVSIVNVPRLNAMSGDSENSLVALSLNEEEETQESDARAEESEFISPPAGFPSLLSPFDIGATYPWTKWVESLRSRKRGDYRPAACINGWFDDPSVNREDPIPDSLWDMKSWDQVSGGSSSILGTVKTASMSVPASLAPRSRTNTITSSSIVASRQSVESNRSSIYDTAVQVAKAMAIRRRHVLCEIYSSEVHYVDGLQTIVQASVLDDFPTAMP